MVGAGVIGLACSMACAFDATGAPITKRMLRFSAPPGMSIVAVPSNPRRTTNASHSRGAVSNAGTHSIMAEA
jgi:hypothetical protein